MKHELTFSRKKWDEVFREIPGVFVEYFRKHNSDSDGSRYIYYPVYEYELGLKKHRLESNVGSSSRKYKPGQAVTLYQNRQTGAVVEKQTGSNLLFGSVEKPYRQVRFLFYAKAKRESPVGLPRFHELS